MEAIEHVLLQHAIVSQLRNGRPLQQQETPRSTTASKTHGVSGKSTCTAIAAALGSTQTLGNCAGRHAWVKRGTPRRHVPKVQRHMAAEKFPHGYMRATQISFSNAITFNAAIFLEPSCNAAIMQRLQEGQAAGGEQWRPATPIRSIYKTYTKHVQHIQNK